MVNLQDLFVVDIEVYVEGKPETKEDSKLQSFEEAAAAVGGGGGVRGGGDGCFGVKGIVVGGMEGCQGDELGRRRGRINDWCA